MKQPKIKLTQEQRDHIEDVLINNMHWIKMYRVACSYDRWYQQWVQTAEDYMITALEGLQEDNK